ncbi:MAG: septum formation initiator family protein [Myxococcales bacterium]|nr:septum formation initiator family protein [Myxococcales bacterium]
MPIALEDGRPMRDLSSSFAWLLPFGLLVFAIIFVPLRILDAQGLPRYRALRQELSHVRETNADLRRELAELDRRVQGLRDNPEAIERIARDELGMLRDGEVIFQFPR